MGASSGRPELFEDLGPSTRHDVAPLLGQRLVVINVESSEALHVEPLQLESWGATSVALRRGLEYLRGRSWVCYDGTKEMRQETAFEMRWGELILELRNTEAKKLTLLHGHLV